VTKILGDDSFKSKQKNQNQSRIAVTPCSAARVRQDGDSTRDPWTKLGNCFFLLRYVLLFFIIMNDTLFKSFSVHLYILSYMV
jgi:hypothetical protein